MIFKCKMCGGDIALNEEKTYGTCECCGTTMTLPKSNDEQRIATFNRGNQFRRAGEFDKAVSLYEQLIRDNDADAEAHWCCAISRFGIEYVEDPSTMEYIPTCHRVSYDNFLEDVDYLASLEHSDGITKRHYQKEALRISEIQKGILATSQNEEPFDVFICYKESDDNGKRTVDSTLAQDIYYQLTDEGYKVFFSRITLEDKVCSEYEPYIFAALNSAKVMVVVGTKKEYLDAVWVKNEWSRFLVLMKKDRNKILLPCYRDMDPYDMPESLSVLQSYDMSKIGFIQDLIRGVKKVTTNESNEKIAKKNISIVNDDTSIAALIKRMHMCLEDRDFLKADHICEQILNMNPENDEAYVGRLQVKYKCAHEEDISKIKKDITKTVDFQRAIQFAGEERVSVLNHFANITKQNNKRRLILNSIITVLAMVFALLITYFIFLRSFIIYNLAINKYEHTEYEDAVILFEKLDDYQQSKEWLWASEYELGNDYLTLGRYAEAIELYEDLGAYKDSEEKHIYAKNEQLYISALAAMENEDYLSAIDLFSQLSDYKDSFDLLQQIKRSDPKTYYKVGDVLLFGDYNGNNTWIILKKEEDKALILSRTSIENMGYDEDPYDVTWETCSLRKWLNTDYLEKAFSSKEQALITTSITDVDSGVEVEDKIFLLSYDEVMDIKENSSDLLKNEDMKFWWLRTIGRDNRHACYVEAKTAIPDKRGIGIQNAYVSVRPALWIDLSKGID